MINFDAVDFSERRSEEVISFFWRSVYICVLCGMIKTNIVRFETGCCVSCVFQVFRVVCQKLVERQAPGRKSGVL